MSAYRDDFLSGRERPDLAPPAPDAEWYEQLAETLLRARDHDIPMPRRPGPERPSASELLREALKVVRPFCATCDKPVERVEPVAMVECDAFRIWVLCHGAETKVQVDRRTIFIAATGDFKALADVLQQRVFEPPMELG